MLQVRRGWRWAVASVVTTVFCMSGCTGLHDYVHKGFKVGPNYCPPGAAVSDQWIDETDLRSECNPEILGHWWTVFGDPKLNELVLCAYRQNLTLKEAGMRILRARAQLAITVGELFPQSQNAFGDYARVATAVDPAAGITSGRFSDQWDFGFGLNWELDFWGRYRRAVTADSAQLDAAVDNYDAAIVTLLGDVARYYVQVRTDQERIRLLKYNINQVQMKVWQRAWLRAGFDPATGKKGPAGGVVMEADADVAESTLKATKASITQIEIDKRQAENQLCVLLGMPVVDLRPMLGNGPIPVAPPDVVVGLPADLLRRRPDVQRAERLAASQAEEIGIAQSDLYPAFSINGTLGYRAQNFPDLFRESAFNGSIGPSFDWNVLNYGRIVNNVRLQDATFKALVLTYQNTVLTANREVEDGLVTFLQAQRRSKLLNEAVQAQARAVDTYKTRYLQGAAETSFATYMQYEQTLLNEQDLMAQAKGQISQGLVLVYRALGGGWELKLNDQAAEAPMPEDVARQTPEEPEPVEEIPVPAPDAVAPSPELPEPPEPGTLETPSELDSQMPQ